MLARLMADGRLALPKALLASFAGVDCFNATVEDGRLVLSPVPSRADEVRKKLEELGVTEADVKDAVAWARVAEQTSLGSAGDTPVQHTRHARVDAFRKRTAQLCSMTANRPQTDSVALLREDRHR